jgi:diguanylate cyclase (GGDEF)-like protein
VRKRARPRPSRASRHAHAGAAAAPATAAARVAAAPTAGAEASALERGLPRPTDRPHGRSHAAHGGILSGPLALPSAIAQVVSVIPTWVWWALLLAAGIAAAAAAAAIVATRRAQRQTRAIEAVERTAATDPLTGVLNRRGFDEAVERELAHARRHGRPLALAYLDVRGLKAVNDTDGHLVGDELIRQVASLLRDCARADDLVGRLGGDEFGLVLAEQSADSAAIVQARLREQLPARRAAIGTDLPWDLTIGTAAYPEDGESLPALLSVADSRLYAQRGIELRVGA